MSPGPWPTSPQASNWTPTSFDPRSGQLGWPALVMIRNSSKGVGVARDEGAREDAELGDLVGVSRPLARRHDQRADRQLGVDGLLLGDRLIHVQHRTDAGGVP